MSDRVLFTCLLHWNPFLITYALFYTSCIPSILISIMASAISSHHMVFPLHHHFETTGHHRHLFHLISLYKLSWFLIYPWVKPLMAVSKPLLYEVDLQSVLSMGSRFASLVDVVSDDLRSDPTRNYGFFGWLRDLGDFVLNLCGSKCFRSMTKDGLFAAKETLRVIPIHEQQVMFIRSIYIVNVLFQLCKFLLPAPALFFVFFFMIYGLLPSPVFRSSYFFMDASELLTFT